MAVITPYYEQVGAELIITWATLANGGTPDTCAPASIPPSFNDKSVQVYGTFGTTATIDIQGTNETAASPTAYASLREPGNATLLSLFTTANGNQIRQILEDVRQIKPVLAGGSGTTALIIKLRCVAAARR